MSNLVLFDPIRDLERMTRWMDRLFDMPGFGRTMDLSLPIDVYEEGGKVIVRAAVPGVKPEELEVSIENDVLTIRGEIKRQHESQDAKVYRREIATGQFARSVRLPDDVDCDAISARFENGMVTITIPRKQAEQTNARRVPIQVVSDVKADEAK